MRKRTARARVYLMCGNAIEIYKCVCVYFIVGSRWVEVVYICVSKGKIARLIDFPIASRRLRTNAPCPVLTPENDNDAYRRSGELTGNLSRD